MKETLMNLKKREEAYLNAQKVGSDEYNYSMNRLLDIERQLRAIDETEETAKRREKEAKSEHRHRMFDHGIDILKVVGTGILLPVIGLVCMTAAEKEITFRGALSDYTKLFIPKK